MCLFLGFFFSVDCSCIRHCWLRQFECPTCLDRCRQAQSRHQVRPVPSSVQIRVPRKGGVWQATALPVWLAPAIQLACVQQKRQWGILYVMHLVRSRSRWGWSWNTGQLTHGKLYQGPVNHPSKTWTGEPQHGCDTAWRLHGGDGWQTPGRPHELGHSCRAASGDQSPEAWGHCGHDIVVRPSEHCSERSSWQLQRRRGRFHIQSWELPGHPAVCSEAWWHSPRRTSSHSCQQCYIIQVARYRMRSFQSSVITSGVASSTTWSGQGGSPLLLMRSLTYQIKNSL